jgi:hypothetical protein
MHCLALITLSRLSAFILTTKLGSVHAFVYYCDLRDEPT